MVWELVKGQREKHPKASRGLASRTGAHGQCNCSIFHVLPQGGQDTREAGKDNCLVSAQVLAGKHSTLSHLGGSLLMSGLCRAGLGPTLAAAEQQELVQGGTAD